jgi:phospholipase C
LLAGPARECPIDTVVVLMMENRSFDHFLGWLGTDEAYLDRGRRRWGARFSVEARQHLRYRAPTGRYVATEQLTARPEDPNPYRICTGPAPGHGWYAGRVQRDHGFLAAGSQNGESAIGYYTADDVPVHAALARRFTVNDHHFASLLGPTFPNRMYFHSAQSEGRKRDPGPLRPGVFDDLTIWDRLTKARVPAAYYYGDTPASILVYGIRMHPYIRVLDRYFEDCAQGTLPNFTFIAPAFGGPLRTDDHPRGCINIGERFLLETFGAFVQSTQWQRGLFIVCFDEWGGFFDHVHPPHLADDRASRIDANDFSQAGFRVPSITASPYARPGAVDHTVYDHTSIMRFLHWRFLGAPAQGPGGATAPWALTKRDRYANNIGRSLWTRQDPEVDLQISVRRPTPSCGNEAALAVQDPEPDAFRLSEDMKALTDRLYPTPTLTPWLD